jgi:general secretion pathway protein L
MHRIVGLDMGAQALRLVVLESGFRGFHVLRAQSVAMPTRDPAAPPHPERIKAALEELGLELGQDAVAVSLPGTLVASHLFTLPFLDARRIEQVLPAEVEGAIPFEIDEVVWDHAVLSQANGKSEVLVAVVRRPALKAWIEALAAAGIDPRIVTFGPLALAAAGERGFLDGMAAPAADEASAAPGPASSCLIIDAEPERADVVLLHDGKAELCRSLSPASAAAWEAAAQSPQGLDKLLNPLVRDLKITLRGHGKRAQKVLPPARILLAGALGQLPAAAARLSHELNAPAAPLALSPAAAKLPEGSAPAHEMALAFGLALRAQQPRGSLNFRKGDLAFTRDFSQVRTHATRLAGAAAILLLLALVLGVARVSSLGRQIRDYDDALCAATRRTLGGCVSDYRQAVSQLSGSSSKAAGIPRVGAADVLAEVIKRLPEGALPQLEEVEVTTTSVRLKGTLDGYGALDPLVSGLKTNKCFGEIKPPRTEKLPREGNKVSFALDFPYTCSGEAPGGA